MRILFISAYAPTPIRVRPYQCIRALLRRGHGVTLVCAASAADETALHTLRQCGATVITVAQGRAQQLTNVVRALPGDLPLQAALSAGPAVAQAVQRVVARQAFDVAHIEHLRAAHLATLPNLPPVVLDAVDSISLLFERTLRRGTVLRSRALALLDLARTRRFEAGYTTWAHRVVVTSPEDAWALRTLAAQHALPGADPQRIGVVPNGVDTEAFAPSATPRDDATLILSGKMSYHANVAAALLLVNEIMPLVWAERPTARVLIAGSAPPPAVRALANDPRVTVTGYVPALQPLLAQATIAVAPLRYGVGIQNKVLEAMACATPVVAARQATTALQDHGAGALLAANTPPEYTAHILSLLQSPRRRTELGNAGRAYVLAHHSWDYSAALLENTYHAALQTALHK